MKESQLRQIVREEIQKLNEASSQGTDDELELFIDNTYDVYQEILSITQRYDKSYAKNPKAAEKRLRKEVDRMVKSAITKFNLEIDPDTKFNSSVVKKIVDLYTFEITNGAYIDQV